MQFPPTRLGPAWALAGALLLGGVVPLAEVVGVGGLASTVLPFLGLALLPLVGLNLALLLRREGRRMAFIRAVGGLLAIGSLALGFWVRWPVRRLMFERLARRLESLVQAVERFEREEGRPPTTLDDVVSGYIEAIPSTQMIGCTQIRYRVIDAPRVMEVSRYELSATPWPTRWRPADAPPHERAGLVVIYDEGGKTQEVDVDGLSLRGDTSTFDPTRWREGGGERDAMARTIDQDGLLKGTKRADVEALLGPPDQAWRLERGAWELEVPCGSGGINWDVFLYWPGHAYPGSGYGGSLERVGTWAYVHE